MLKKISYLFCIFFILIFVSCNNIFLNREKTNDISLYLPDDVATRLANRAGGGSDYTVKITFHGINKAPYITSISKDKINSTIFKFDKIPLRKPFTISIKIYDNDNAILSGNSDVVKINSVKTPSKVNINLGFPFTDTPVTVRTQTINGKSYDIVEFGDWPQTKKLESVTVGKEVTLVNGWECYVGSDLGYYVKVKATPYEIAGSKYTFSDSSEITKNSDYYFKMEPIKWRVLTNNYHGQKLLFSENALGNCPFFPKISNDTRQLVGEGTSILNNNYKYSSIRAFLNGYNYINPNLTLNYNYREKGFLQKAFSPLAIMKIIDTEVDNSKESGKGVDETLEKPIENYCENTKDKIFLLSLREVTTDSYGFDGINVSVDPKLGVNSSTRHKIPTDYAKSTGIYCREKYDNKLFPVYWLRSPSHLFGEQARIIPTNGSASGQNSVDISNYGVVPALCISN